MRKLLLSGAAFTALAVGPAIAADLSVRAPRYAPPPPPVYSWTGFYAGLNAGYEWTNNDSVDSVGIKSFANPNFLAGSTAVANALAGLGTYNLGGNNNGFIGGGQIGYNRQFGSWVTGLVLLSQKVAGDN